MAYRIPTFNITANVWHGNPLVPPVAAPDLVVLCQLTWDRTGDFSILPRAASTVLVHFMQMRVPAHTDIRGIVGGSIADIAEVPAGSGRFYTIYHVDDVGKGFANEYRIGLIVPVQFPWPLP